MEGSTKEEWERAAEESREYENVSHLVKLAVHREIHGQAERSGSYTPDTTNGELLDAIRDLQGDVNGVASDVQLVHGEVAGSPDIPPSTPTGFLKAFPTDKAEAMTFHEILEEFEDLSHPELNRIMEQVETQVRHVKQTEKDGERAYYREV